MQPLAAHIVFVLDEGEHKVPSVIEFASLWIWWLLSLPGMAVENRGYLTMLVVCGFWAIVGASLSRALKHASTRHRTRARD